MNCLGNIRSRFNPLYFDVGGLVAGAPDAAGKFLMASWLGKFQICPLTYAGLGLITCSWMLG
jgi:hypothetical protein